MNGLGNAQILGRNLRKYVDQSGKLGKDIASAIGVAPATFSEWMNGKKYPRIDKIEMLADYFHIQKSDLIEDKGDQEELQFMYSQLSQLSPEELDELDAMLAEQEQQPMPEEMPVAPEQGMMPE